MILQTECHWHDVIWVVGEPAWSWNLHSRSRLKEDCSIYFSPAWGKQTWKMHLFASSPLLLGATEIGGARRNFADTRHLHLGWRAEPFRSIGPSMSMAILLVIILDTGPSTNSLETCTQKERRVSREKWFRLARNRGDEGCCCLRMMDD